MKARESVFQRHPGQVRPCLRQKENFKLVQGHKLDCECMLALCTLTAAVS